MQYSSALHAPTLSLELRASLVRQSRFIEAMSGPDVGIELRPPRAPTPWPSHSLTLLLSRAMRFARSPGTALHPDGMDASELERRAVRVLCVCSPH